MKRVSLILLLVGLVTSCFKDDKEIEYAKVYLPLASRADANGVFNASFKSTSDTTFIVGAYCAGSIMTPSDVNVQMAMAVDEFEAAKASNPALAAYDLLPERCYEIQPSDLNVVIKANTERADLKVNFSTGKFMKGKKYILPLKIESVSQYEIADTYNVLFFGVTAN